jgi:Fe-S oxidoreductase
MCPIFRFAPREEASPRAKANLIRAIMSGRLDSAELAGDELKSVVDLCVNCHQCRFECPANVDIPKLVLEAKAQYVATNGLRLYQWLMARVDLLSSFGSLFPSTANWAIRNRRMRWLIEKTLGIAQGRKLPRFTHHSFLQEAHRKRLTRPTRSTGRKVLYFVDVYANWHDTQLARALVAVLEHNGVAVYVHPDQVPSGSSAISLGAVDRARRLASKNIGILADAVRQGYHIVASEPAAALCLKHEYLNLLDEDDARLVAENTSEACSYLCRMHQSGQLELDLKPINVTLGYHLPCHLKALEVGSPGEILLRLIPGLIVQRIDKGCSGMAGTFGLERKNYRSSLRAGWGLISALRDPKIQSGTTECSACKIQMEQGTTKPTIHPLKILALAYDRMPEVASLLNGRGEELIVT